ncbi:MAG: spore coat associated protein CotJA [Clostridium sp.]|uniref:spore coat associated protein CotJA n=1 Tax=Clostridium sp. TaxID=1506 RepID=UPI0039E7D99B
MYENFFPCINPDMMRYTEKNPYTNIYNNTNWNPSNANSNPNPKIPNNLNSNPKIPNNNVAANSSDNNAAISSSGCGYNPNNLELARAYMPIQTYVGLLPLNEGLKRGSIFPNINLNYPRL